LNEVMDVDRDFRNFSNTYYLADRLAAFDPATASGRISYQRSQYFTRQAFDNMLGVLAKAEANEFPSNEYEADPVLPFSIEFVSPKTVRIRATSGPQLSRNPSLMLAGPVPVDRSWRYSKIEGGHRYTGSSGSVSIMERPWRIELRDAEGRLLTRTNHTLDNSTTYTPVLPFSFVRRAADFGEAAPANGIYASGRTGFYEHNLYPLRYNKAVADITKETTGENIIWARSAWAGSQRYPLHWGGDAESTDQGMAAELRGGLSFGLSGFSFWSHDVGGFTGRADAGIYLRWLAFGALTSHTRCHGVSPKEPWEYGEEVMAEFRRIDEMKYRLMPYVYAQAKDSSERGLPMLRALFIEYPEDPGSWLVDDEYLFGSDMLVAPLFEDERARSVYLPPGNWIDYQTGQIHAGGWSRIEAGGIPAVIMIRDGAAIPHIKLAQSTDSMDWSSLELVVFASESRKAQALVCLPAELRLHKLALRLQGDQFQLSGDPLAGKVK
jgi:hypothetical protein